MVKKKVVSIWFRRSPLMCTQVDQTTTSLQLSPRDSHVDLSRPRVVVDQLIVFVGLGD